MQPQHHRKTNQKKHNIMKILKGTIFVLIIFAIAYVLSSCSSSRKMKNRTHTNTAIITNEKKIAEATATTDSNGTKESNKLSVGETEIEFEGETASEDDKINADDYKPVSRDTAIKTTINLPGGVSITTSKGIRSIKTKGSNQEQVKESATKNSTQEVKTSEEKNTTAKQEIVEDKKDKQRSGPALLVWLFMIGGALLIIYFVLRKKKNNH